MEIWKDIKGYEGLYQVSNEGRVKSLERKVKHCDYLITIKEKILKTHNSNGYPMTSLCKNGIAKPVCIHRILAEAFIDNSDNKPEVDHIIPVSEGGTNELSNLRWVTHKENLNNIISIKKNSVAHKGRKSWMKGKHHTEESKQKMSEYHKQNPSMYWLGKHRSEESKKKMSEAKKGCIPSNIKKVYQYTLDDKLVKIWDSTCECGKNGFHQGDVSACCRNNYLRKNNNKYKGFKWSYQPL